MKYPLNSLRLFATALVVVGTVHAQPPDSMLGGRLSIPVGEKPRGVALGDFNGDGHTDIVVNNQNGNSLTVLLGGTGWFKTTAASPIKVGAAPRTPVVADFNGDGKLDLVVPNSENGTVSLLLGDGTGNFTPAPGPPARFRGRPIAIAVGDFNGDGKADLAVANNLASCVHIQIGNGDGTFETLDDTPRVGSTPFHIEAADFNGDKKLDLAVANYGSNTVSFLMGKGAGAFAPRVDISTGPSPRALACADFNRDGKMDMVVTNLGSNSISLFRGDGTGKFPTRLDFAVGGQPRCFAVADFNRDGRLDLAVVNETSDNVSILLGDDTNGFTPSLQRLVRVGNGPSFGVTGDLNGDGIADLAISNGTSNDLSLFRGLGNSWFRPMR